tara:strand:+ start:142171 stop:143511 length:1341 start_codon:yes stop_codon:yes gene_type:complete
MKPRNTLTIVLLWFCVLAQTRDTWCDNGTLTLNDSSSFWRPAKPIGQDLPADQYYPRGRLFPFSGFAGVPERDRPVGYSLLGPVYVEPAAFLASATEAGVRVIYPIGIGKEELAASETNPLSDAEIRTRIQQQVAGVRANDSIAWWYLVPEELRYWREHEINYLKVAAEAIRQADPKDRPIWIYEPNHRTAESLAITGKYVDIIGKGAYTNFAGQTNSRVWIRWSMEQQTDAIEALGGNQTPILVPEMFQDPQPQDRGRIADWVRHDVVLGLIHGAKGVVVYSLFNRPQLENSFDDYYDAYAGIARELLQNRKLGEVILFGEARSDLVIEQVTGPENVLITPQQAKVEANSLTETEQQEQARISYPAISTRELAFGNKRYLFVCNSSDDQSVELSVTGFPPGSTLVTEAFSFNFLHPRIRGAELHDAVPPLGVRCYVFSEFSPIGQ